MTKMQTALILTLALGALAACSPVGNSFAPGSPQIQSPDGSDGSFDNDTDWAALSAAKYFAV